MILSGLMSEYGMSTEDRIRKFSIYSRHSSPARSICPRNTFRSCLSFICRLTVCTPLLYIGNVCGRRPVLCPNCARCRYRARLTCPIVGVYRSNHSLEKGSFSIDLLSKKKKKICVYKDHKDCLQNIAPAMVWTTEQCPAYSKLGFMYLIS